MDYDITARTRAMNKTRDVVQTRLADSIPGEGRNNLIFIDWCFKPEDRWVRDPMWGIIFFQFT
jgi:hypothetical protein